MHATATSKDPRDNPHRYEVAAGHVPDPLELEDVRERNWARRRKVDASVVNDLLPLLLPDEEAAVRRCRKNVGHLLHKPSQTEELVAFACKTMWCPWCPGELHRVRAARQLARIASLDPASEPTARLFHVVLKLPRELHEFVLTSEKGFDAYVHAFKLFLTRSWGYKTRGKLRADQVAMREMGATINVHAFGDEAEPWGIPSPHLDTLIACWKREGDQLVELRATWPDKYGEGVGHVNDVWRGSIRAAFMRVAPIELQPFLATDFWVDAHIAKGDVGAQKTTSAAHAVWYSSRPLLDLAYASIEHDSKGIPWIRYDREFNNGKTIHKYASAGPALANFRRMRDFLGGGKARRHIGILSGNTYKATCQISGHPPVSDDGPKEYARLRTYYPAMDGMFHEEDVERALAHS